MVSRRKVRSGIKFNLRGRRNSSMDLKDGSQEKKIIYQLENSKKKFVSMEEFSPEFLINMVEILHIVEEVEALKIPPEDLDEVNEILKPAIRYMIDIYSPEIEGMVGRHFLHAIEQTEDFVTDMDMDYLEDEIKTEPILNYIIMTTDYNKKINPQTSNKERKDLLLDYIRGFYVDIDWDFKESADETMKNPEFRKLLIDYWSHDLDPESWYRVWDLLDAVHDMETYRRDYHLIRYLEQYKGMFLTKRNINSEIALFKEVEENVRDLWHHAGKLVSGFDYDEQSEEFFKMLSHYGEPTLEKWRKEMDKFLEEAGVVTFVKT